MLTQGPARRVTIYVTEASTHHHQPVYLAVLNFLFYHGVSGATVTRGVAGFGADHHMHSTQFEVTSANLPLKVEFIDSADRIDQLLPTLYEMVPSGLIEVQDTMIVKPPKTSAATKPRPVALRGPAKMVQIFIGENDQWHDKPLYHAIVESARSHEIAGATVCRGIEGFGASSRIHQRQLLRLSSDLPLVVTIIDEATKIDAFMPVLSGMVSEGLIAISDVDVIRYVHRDPSSPDPGGLDERAVAGGVPNGKANP